MYKEFVSPLLDHFDSETMHTRTRELLHFAERTPMTLRMAALFGHGIRKVSDERLKVLLGGRVQLDNPVMVGAGWDRVGRAMGGLFALGFSADEVGTVPAYGQPGNETPREFIIAPGVATNHIGFYSDGMEDVADNLEWYRSRKGLFKIKYGAVGINVGKNKLVPNEAAPSMHALVVERLYDFANYFVINPSSPNTPRLRELLKKVPLALTVQAVNKAMDQKGGRKPLYIKISPDDDYWTLEDVIEVAANEGVTGIIATNTTLNQQIKSKYLAANDPRAKGGLSGDDPDFRWLATERVAHIYRRSGGQLEVIGVGGVKDTLTALEKIAAGARAVQVVTAIRGEGPAIAGKINAGLIEFMDRENIRSLDEVRGIRADEYHIPEPTGEYYPDFEINKNPLVNRLLYAEMPENIKRALLLLLNTPTSSEELTQQTIKVISELLSQADDENSSL